MHSNDISKYCYQITMRKTHIEHPLKWMLPCNIRAKETPGAILTMHLYPGNFFRLWMCASFLPILLWSEQKLPPIQCNQEITSRDSSQRRSGTGSSRRSCPLAVEWTDSVQVVVAPRMRGKSGKVNSASLKQTQVSEESESLCNLTAKLETSSNNGRKNERLG